MMENYNDIEMIRTGGGDGMVTLYGKSDRVVAEAAVKYTDYDPNEHRLGYIIPVRVIITDRRTGQILKNVKP